MIYKAAQLPPTCQFFATFTSAKACRAGTGKMSAPAEYLKKLQEYIHIDAMKFTLFISLLLVSVNLSGQNLDSLRNAVRSDASWAITHGEFSKGEKLLDSLMLLEPNNSKNYFEKAKIYYFQIKEDSLLINLNRSLSLGMDSLTVLNQIYDFYTFQKNDNAKRIEAVNSMISNNPNNSELYIKRSGVWTDLRNFDESWKDLEHAASLGNENAKIILQEIILTRKKLQEKGIIK